MPYMVTFAINIPQMLPYIPYMDPVGWLPFRMSGFIPLMSGPSDAPATNARHGTDRDILRALRMGRQSGASHGAMVVQASSPTMENHKVLKVNDLEL